MTPQQAAEAFIASDPTVAALADPAEALGRCSRTTQRLVTYARCRSLRCEKITGFSEARGHHAAVVFPDHGLVVDLTYRQFDPSTPFPLVEDEAAYRARWDGTGRDVWEAQFDAWEKAS